ncbi:putative phage abortive infection protein [Priestia megaterium]|uniref:putative phage abortive infection protein n=1 Tax=Priestia megaterium TaxID=1404 RepID=UPI0025AF1B26|nr:putative phage abortive infection protein [Priestia megaterium]MDN3365411.1 putative phage abortive infection protein [Priestia megaterium]
MSNNSEPHDPNTPNTPTNPSNLNYDKYLRVLFKSLYWSWVPLAVGIVLVLFGVPFADYGPFGDFFAGSTVPILTLISSIGVILTLRMQQEQLELQRIELRNSVEEMKDTKLEIKEQGKTMSLQRFENTFFNMLTLHNSIVQSLDVFSDGHDIKNRQVFMYIAGQLRGELYSLIGNYKLKEDEPDFKKITATYASIYETYESHLGHYFRNLYRIVKFVHESQLSYDEKRNYIGIIRAQLSSSELVLLLYNGLSELGENFLPLMKEYNLLDNLNEDLLTLTKSDVEIFRQYAKGKEN